jgi:hypothetical protein
VTALGKFVVTFITLIGFGIIEVAAWRVTAGLI